MSLWEQVTHRWDDDGDVSFVLDQHAYLDCDSACPMTQHPADTHVAPLVDTLLSFSKPHRWCNG